VNFVCGSWVFGRYEEEYETTETHSLTVIHVPIHRWTARPPATSVIVSGRSPRPRFAFG